MSNDDLLARELAKLGAVGGALGGASGAWFAAQFLPTETASESLVLSYGPQTALPVILKTLAKLGQLQETAETDSPNPMFSAVVGSGFLDLNPCVITVEMISSGNNETGIVVHGGAKEGLIKQRTAEKAVTRVIEALAAAGNDQGC